MRIMATQPVGFNQKSNNKKNQPAFGMTTDYFEHLVSPKAEEELLLKLSSAVESFNPYAKQGLYLSENANSWAVRFLRGEKFPNGKFLDLFNFDGSYCLDVHMPFVLGCYHIKTTGGMTEKSRELWKGITETLSGKVPLK